MERHETTKLGCSYQCMKTKTHKKQQLSNRFIRKVTWIKWFWFFDQSVTSNMAIGDLWRLIALQVLTQIKRGIATNYIKQSAITDASPQWSFCVLWTCSYMACPTWLTFQGFVTCMGLGDIYLSVTWVINALNINWNILDKDDNISMANCKRGIPQVFSNGVTCLLQ